MSVFLKPNILCKHDLPAVSLNISVSIVIHNLFIFISNYSYPNGTMKLLNLLVYCTMLRVQYDILQGTVQYDILLGTILYSYLMGVDAIDETICPSVLGMTKCSIAFGRWPHAIEHLMFFNIII
jgi:hypothetical protein